jgi:hypothetical protein
MRDIVVRAWRDCDAHKLHEDIVSCFLQHVIQDTSLHASNMYYISWTLGGSDVGVCVTKPHPLVQMTVYKGFTMRCTVKVSLVDDPVLYRPSDVVDFLRYVETAAAAVPGLLPDDQKLFQFPLYTFK